MSRLAAILAIVLSKQLEQKLHAQDQAYLEFSRKIREVRLEGASMPELQKLSLAKDADAMCELGNRYFRGQGVDKNIDRAFHWWRLAEKAGNQEATIQMALLNVRGVETSLSPADAIRSLEKASGAGCHKCAHLAAQLLLAGDGVPKDEARGLKLLLEAAQNGNAEAQFEVGWRLEQGNGLPKNDLLAEDYYLRSIKGGAKSGSFNLAMLLTRQESEDKGRRGLGILAMLAAAGDAEAQLNYAQFLMRGHFIKHDEKAAYEWFLKAAAQGEPLAQLMVAVFKIQGEIVPKDLLGAYLNASQAAPTLAKAAEIRGLIEPMLSDTELAEAQRQLRSLLRK